MKFKVTIEQQESENRWAESITGEVDDRNISNLLREVVPAFLRSSDDRIVLQVVKEEPDAYDPEGDEEVE